MFFKTFVSVSFGSPSLKFNACLSSIHVCQSVIFLFFISQHGLDLSIKLPVSSSGPKPSLSDGRQAEKAPADSLEVWPGRCWNCLSSSVLMIGGEFGNLLQISNFLKSWWFGVFLRAFSQGKQRVPFLSEGLSHLPDNHLLHESQALWGVPMTLCSSTYYVTV